MTTLADFTATNITGASIPLENYVGQVVLVVNTASKCGFTGQYSELEALYQEFAAQGFTVLGFPCNQFGHQEPADEAAIASFCTLNFGVTFPMFAKVDVNGPDAHPLWSWLTQEKKGLMGERVMWNFTKFLIGRDGKVVKRYPPTTSPAQLRSDIAELLGAKSSDLHG